jgi:CxxC-x17-CxxC domain-containing protein
MGFKDKTLECTDCGKEFTFSADEQELFESRGYTNDPKRCTECRQARKAQRYGNNGDSYGNNRYGSNSNRQMFPVTCADCGKETEVPFQPRGDRPVYCSDCFRKVKLTR